MEQSRLTANELQIMTIELNFSFMERTFEVKLSKEERKEYALQWVKTHGKTFRKCYNRGVS